MKIYEMRGVNLRDRFQDEKGTKQEYVVLLSGDVKFQEMRNGDTLEVELSEHAFGLGGPVMKSPTGTSRLYRQDWKPTVEEIKARQEVERMLMDAVRDLPLTATPGDYVNRVHPLFESDTREAHFLSLGVHKMPTRDLITVKWENKYMERYTVVFYHDQPVS